MKLFVVSDVHSYLTEMKQALDKAGFDQNNPEHLFIGCGDYFDRGNESQQMLDYLLQLPNKVLVRGNHEDLMRDMCDRGYPLSHDTSNRTAHTAYDLAPNTSDWKVICSVAYHKLKPLYDEMVDYFETRHYIFCHSWIPRHTWIPSGKDWRHARNSAWESARWVNPFKAAEATGNNTGKIIVHGHWSNSYYWAIKNGTSEYGDDACFDICKHNGCIGLDTCTALTHRVNVLVLKDELLDS